MKALKAHPEQYLSHVAPLNLAGLDRSPTAAEQTRFDREIAARDARLQAAEDFKYGQIERIFKKLMAVWLRSKIM